MKVAGLEVGNPDQIASAVASTTAHGTRALDLRAWGGIDVRLLPDRGLDIGAAWYRGVPLAWISAVGERGPLAAPRGMDTLAGFGGGLVTTCGLRNVGEPSDGHPLHGELSQQPARDIVVRRSDETLQVSARITEVDALRWHLEVHRTVTVRIGEGTLSLVDVPATAGASRRRSRSSTTSTSVPRCGRPAPRWRSTRARRGPAWARPPPSTRGPRGRA